MKNIYEMWILKNICSFTFQAQDVVDEMKMFMSGKVKPK